ncbi:DUF2000 domain-containing protein [Humibacter ginsengisoli]
MIQQTIGFDSHEVDPWVSTREARLKWVIVIDTALSPGRAANAAVCVAAATAALVPGLAGPDAVDASESVHPGLPWAGCTILAATAETLRDLRATAAKGKDIFIADMPQEAQRTRLYGEYLDQVAGSHPNALEYLAVSIVGPRNRVSRMVGQLPLLK